MAALGLFLRNQIIDVYLRNQAVTQTTSVFLVLFTGPVDPANPFATEVPATDYTRPAVTFEAPVNGRAANTNRLAPTVATVQTVTHIGIANAATTGQLLFYGETSDVTPLAAGEAFEIEIGDLDVNTE